MIQWLIDHRNAITNWLGFGVAAWETIIQWISTNPWDWKMFTWAMVFWIVSYFTGKGKQETKPE